MPLQIVGLGPARPEHMTIEAQTVIHTAIQQGYPIYGLAHARSLVHQLYPKAHIRSLDYLYELPGIDRPRAYHDLATMLIRKAFEDNLQVVYLVAGSPLFYNDAVTQIRQLSAQRNQTVQLIHGMSFVDLVLDQVLWNGHHGLQLYAAWNIAFDGIKLQPHAPSLLCQLGEFTREASALESDKSTSMLTILRDALLHTYPADHPVTILYSSGKPDYSSLSNAIPLAQLADQPVPVYSNLWIPGLDDLTEGEISAC